MENRRWRACKFTPRVRFWDDVMPHISSFLATIVVIIWIEHDRGTNLGSEVLPVFVGLIVFFGFPYILYMVRFAHCFLTGRVPDGSERTLRGLGSKLADVEAVLRNDVAGSTIIKIVDDLPETYRFGEEIKDLLKRCGWSEPALEKVKYADPIENIVIAAPYNRNVERVASLGECHHAAATLPELE